MRRNRIQRELKMQRRTLMKAAITAVTLTALQATTAIAENTVLKIGFVGVTSGPAAAWGISNHGSMEARAACLKQTDADARA